MRTEVMICGSKKWGCRPEMEKQWTGETENGSEKNEIGVRNVFRKLTVSVDRIGAWIGVDRSGSEWIGVWIGVWVGIRLELGSSGSE